LCRIQDGFGGSDSSGVSEGFLREVLDFGFLVLLGKSTKRVHFVSVLVIVYRLQLKCYSLDEEGNMTRLKPSTST